LKRAAAGEPLREIALSSNVDHSTISRDFAGTRFVLLARRLDHRRRQVPGMLYGAVLRAPVEGAAPDKIDESKARAVAGVIKVIRMPYGVGVVAETPWAAFAAREALTQPQPSWVSFVKLLSVTR
jgi:hypothetical protein